MKRFYLRCVLLLVAAFAFTGKGLTQPTGAINDLDLNDNRVQYTIQTTSSPSNAGTASGGGTYSNGETCTLHASAYYGYYFQNWTKNGTVVGTEVDYSFTVTENATYVANFTPRSYTITVSCEPSNGGSVSGAGTYLYDEICTLLATPAPGYYFAGWKSYGDFFLGSNPLIDQVGDNGRYTALFELIPVGNYVGDGSSNNSIHLPSRVAWDYSLSQQLYMASEIGMSGGGNIYGISFFAACDNFTSNYDVYLVHTDKTSFTSDNDWIAVTGDDLVFSGQVTMQQAKWANIIFDRAFEYDGTSNLAVIVDNNTGSVSTSFWDTRCRVFETPSNQAISRETYGVNIDPFSLSGYSGERYLEKNQIVFINNTYAITAVPNPSNGGVVTGGGAFPANSTCVLSATANPGYVFTHWTENGTVVSSDANYSFTLRGNRTIVANFSEFGGGGDYVDLGLPSGTMWATCNLGANAPEEYGDYFAWGETQTKDNYRWTTYQHCMGSGTTLTKYCSSSDYGYNGFNDDLTILLPEDDAARAYKGEDWRMPSAEEWLELKQNTTNEWATLNGVSGWLFTASNGATLFLPAAGCRTYEYLFETGTDGMYWSNSLSTGNPDEAFQFYFYSNYCRINDYPRDYGFPIRPIRPGQNMFSINVTTSPTVGGTVSGDGNYLYGTQCILTATASEGYTFANWTENGIQLSTNTSYTFTVRGARNLEAHFIISGSGGHEYVDLGLPSGTLWATCNVGANAPEVYGDDFSWGETQPDNGSYYWNTYQHCNGDPNTLTKYCNNSSYGYNGFTDDLTVLLPEDDAATVNWGEDWRMPTPEEFEELCNNTTVTWVTQNGVDGRLFTAANGNSLFLPATSTGSSRYGYYWSSMLNLDKPTSAWYFYFSSGNSYGMRNYLERFNGFPVRPVRTIKIISFSINATPNPVEGGEVSGGGIYPMGAECTLIATPNEGYTFINWTENGNVVSTNTTYTFTVTENRSLVANFEPATQTQTIILASGWNWVSFNMEVTMDDLKAAIVAAAPGAAPVIKSKGNGQTSYNGAVWVGALKTLDLSQMYEIKVANACIVTLEGMPVNPADHPATIKNGVNWIAYPLSETKSVANAFAGFPVTGDNVKSKDSGQATWNGVMWLGALKNLVPGTGYLYISKAAGDKTLTF